MTITKLTILYVFLIAGLIVPAHSLKAEKNLIPVVLQLDWAPNAQFAGIYQAVKQGFYVDAGMEVEIRPLPEGQSSVEIVLHETADYVFGVIESTVLLQAGVSESGIKAIATMFQDSPLGWMSLTSAGIQSPADFKGKKIGVHSDGMGALDLVLEQAGLSRDQIQMVEVGWDPIVLVDGKVDLMQGYYIDEFVRLQLLTGGKSKIMLARDYGYQAYSQVIITTETMMAERHDLVEKFLQASREGWKYALDHVEETADLVIAKYSPHLDRGYQVASLQRIAELVSPDGQPPLAAMRADKWKASQKILLKAGILSEPANLDQLLDFSANP